MIGGRGGDIARDIAANQAQKDCKTTNGVHAKVVRE